MNSAQLCMECDEIITEPICADCLAQRMQVVVKEYNKKLAAQIRSGVVEEGEMNCLFCGRKMNLCAHCFSREIYDFLKEKNSNLAEEFLGRFDFDLRRSLV